MPAPKPHADQDPDFVYVIYILAAPQKVWDTLTDSETVRPWWAHTRHDSTFEVGDPITYLRHGKVDVRGEILEREAPSRLTYTFHIEGPGPLHDEGPSVVTYELKAASNGTMLKITHTNFPRGSASRAGVSNGWPAILSSLKSAMESGKALLHDEWERADAAASAQLEKAAAQ
jgi:uncharacterized protein YndB with AHSA1/START domain